VTAARTFFLGARLAAAFTVAGRLAARLWAEPPLGPAATPSGPSISVVIPARDEEMRLRPCLAALARAPGVAEIVVVDDRSADATADVARSHGARVVTGEPPPPGWAGKAWALQQGVESATGEWVVCLDADTRPDPRLPAAMVARACADGTDLLSVAGRFDCPTAPLRMLHPALLTTLVYRYGAPGGSPGGRPVVNGQCLAFHRRGFLADGGCVPVRGHVVEDVALARHRVGLGRRVAFVDGLELLAVRAYEDAGDAWRGWGRSLALPGVEPRARQLVDIATVWLAQALPLARLVARRADPLDLALLALRAGTLAGTRRAYPARGLAYWASPLADSGAAALLTWGAVPRARRWKGRTYPAKRTRRGEL
jgi:dolichol-phosphate mannosyltransferase